MVKSTEGLFQPKKEVIESSGGREKKIAILPIGK